jgi:ATP-dependent Clp protease ATP-binding subunit ClpC
MSDMFKNFTDRSRKVVALAHQEAQRFNNEYIDSEHVLLGLLKEGQGVGASVLRNFGVDLQRACLEVESLIKK